MLFVRCLFLIASLIFWGSLWIFVGDKIVVGKQCGHKFFIVASYLLFQYPCQKLYSPFSYPQETFLPEGHQNTVLKIYRIFLHKRIFHVNHLRSLDLFFLSFETEKNNENKLMNDLIKRSNLTVRFAMNITLIMNLSSISNWFLSLKP